MKKFLTLAFALVFTTGIAFGQAHQANIDQVGSNNESDLTQQSITESSPSEANISQNGNLNATTLEQLEFGLGGHFAEIKQTGTKNEVDARTQGHQHNLYIDQEGNENRAGADGVTGVKTLNLGDEIDIDQLGNKNEADVYLWPGDNNATVFQDGNRNSADISYDGQNGSPSFEGMELRVYQDGNRNIGNINVEFDIAGTIGGEADIVQLGNDNEGYIDQLDGIDTAEMRQSGDSNFGSVEQADGGNTFTLVQKNGALNEARLNQSGGGTANILQKGSQNIVQGITGASSVGVSANGSILDVDQLGTGNTLSLNQTDGSTATVFQEGTSNTSTVTQVNN